jgi:hypothetical protein
MQMSKVPIISGYVPLLADFFLYSYEVDFIQWPLKENEKKLARSFNFTFSYIDDVLSLNNSRLGDFVDCFYHIKIEKRYHRYTLKLTVRDG